MGFSNGLKIVQQNRKWATKARMKYRDKIDSSSTGVSPLQFNNEFETKHSPEQLKKLKAEVRKEIRDERIRHTLYTFGIIILFVVLVKFIFF